MPGPSTTAARVEPGRLGGAEHMREQRRPGQTVQHLGQVGFHPRAFAGGKDDGECGSISHTALDRCGNASVMSANSMAGDAERGVSLLGSSCWFEGIAESAPRAPGTAICLVQSLGQGHNPRSNALELGSIEEIDRGTEPSNLPIAAAQIVSQALLASLFRLTFSKREASKLWLNIAGEARGTCCGARSPSSGSRLPASRAFISTARWPILPRLAGNSPTHCRSVRPRRPPPSPARAHATGSLPRFKAACASWRSRWRRSARNSISICPLRLRLGLRGGGAGGQARVPCADTGGEAGNRHRAAGSPARSSRRGSEARADASRSAEARTGGEAHRAGRGRDQTGAAGAGRSHSGAQALRAAVRGGVADRRSPCRGRARGRQRCTGALSHASGRAARADTNACRKPARTDTDTHALHAHAGAGRERRARSGRAAPRRQ